MSRSFSNQPRVSPPAVLPLAWAGPKTKVFLSYSRKDSDFVTRLAAANERSVDRLVLGGGRTRIRGISTKRVNFIYDADVRAFFDSVSQEWLIWFLEHRIGDPSIIRLIRKWLTAGVLENGVVTTSDTGTGQGSVISPLLPNVYPHVFDLGLSAGDAAAP